MDLRDFEIVTEINRHPFTSNESIGRAVGTTGAAVKVRIGRMEHEGVLSRFQVVPSARVFRRYHHMFVFTGLEPEPELGDLLRPEDVVSVWRGSQGSLAVNVFSLSQEPVPPSSLLDLTGGPPDQAVLVNPPRESMDPNAILSPLDWRVIGALLDRPTATLEELARSTGLTPRTVRKRRDSLVERENLTVIPTLDTSREPGLIVFAAYVGVQSVSDLERVQVPGLSVVRIHHDPLAAVLSGYASTYAGAREAERILRNTPGISRVEIIIPRGAAVATTRLRHWVRKELERWRPDVREGERSSCGRKRLRALRWRAG